MLKILIFLKHGYYQNQGGDFSSNYASANMTVLNQIFSYAKQLQILENNLCDEVPRIKKEKSNIKYWTKNEFEKVISNIYIDDYYEHYCFVMLWLYYMTGIRVNEGTALTWDDIDFNKSILRINKTLLKSKKDDIIIQNSTKTDSSNRVISLDSDTLDILSNWKIKQNNYVKSNYVLSYNGFPSCKSTISRIIKRYSKISGVHPIQAKGLRHSHASYLINELNASILVVSKRLGHSSPEITLKYYAHLYSGIDEELASKMTGNISIKTSDKPKFNFDGNQYVKHKKV